MTTSVLGLDIGGANLKAAHVGGAARSIAFPLWKHPDRLATALADLCATMPAYDCLAITMTGELCDCYESRREGVLAILQNVRSVARTLPVRVWSSAGAFLDLDAARADPLAVAAVNWLALAHAVARQFPDDRILLIDTGSTTTDIAYLDQGVPQPHAVTDLERLTTGELVYTGIRRTPICAVLGMKVAAEFFATMLDAYVVQGLLPENPDDRDSADGRPMTRGAARARLARLRCADAETFSEEQALLLAGRAIETQRSVVAQACHRVLTGRPDVQRVIVSGSGSILGRLVAERLSKPVALLADRWGPALSVCACAYAVALLATIRA
ncbi:MAG: H4MPT-linked C1 transfer pathway protein [Planctomycetes bacterium]|nr:H4MPT-linked C1 transfer pathway protein [Planctomycetota bacterium]